MAHRKHQEIQCPNPRHQGGKVYANGVRVSRGVTFRRYMCSPKPELHEKPHMLQVPIDDGTGDLLETPLWQPPPRCPNHPGAKVIRNGWYGTAGQRRQKYRCQAPTGEHELRVPLPRSYVADRDGNTRVCDICGEPLGIHHGEQAAAYRHRWTAHLVAEGLKMAADGESYGKIGTWARRVGRGEPETLPKIVRPKEQESGPDGQASPPPAGQGENTLSGPARRRKPNEARSRSNRSWQIGAGWVENFTPAIWEPLEAKMRAAALAERRRVDAEIEAGQKVTKPIVWLADELPIKGAGRRELFCVLIVAECLWDDSDTPTLHLRLARALPDRGTAAWQLVLHEIAGSGSETIWPDFIVSDASVSLLRAARLLFGEKTRWVPSLWHLGNAVRLAVDPGFVPGQRTEFDDLEAHLRELERDEIGNFMDLADWTRWWDQAEKIVEGITGTDSTKNKRSRALASRRETYEKAYAQVIPDLAGTKVHLSNGGLEQLQRARIGRLFVGRRNFTNSDRTNYLLELAVAKDRFVFDRIRDVVALLRRDAMAFDGWTSATRSIGDPIGDRGKRDRFMSLRDRGLSSRLALRAGLL